MKKLFSRSGSSPTPEKSPPAVVPRVPVTRRRFWLRVGAGALVLVAGLEGGRRYLISQLPPAREVFSFNRPGTLTFVSADGVVLQKIGPATRDKVTLTSLPPLVVKAFLAAEDRRFYDHWGIDPLGIARAAVTNALTGEVSQGASTITQQLARIVFLDQEQSLLRKAREALMAHKLEQQLTKDQILEAYLNLVYLGSGAYGVADAAWAYFSKTPDQLTLPEMAMIAGLPPAPTLYSPLVNPNYALERRNIVLARMADAGYITEAQAQAAKRQPLALKPGDAKYAQSLAPYFTNYVRQVLPRILTPDQLEMGGLVLQTTLNYRWQQAAEQALTSSLYGDLQGAITSVDPRSGAIRTMVGGRDFASSQFNRATQAQRQPGSTFKAFIYTAAIASGMTPDTVYVDAPISYGGYSPQNFGRSYSGPLTLTRAITNSVNVISVKLLHDVGIDNVITLARRMGIRSDLARYYPLALGASDVNLLEITSAYGTLANQGLHWTPHPLAKIIDHRGRVAYQDQQIEPVRALDADSAALVLSMMQNVVREGTGVAAALPDRSVAGKTGTSEKARDLWFIGMIPQLVTGVWLGYDDFSPTGGGSYQSAEIWYRFMSQILKDLPPQPFPKLPDLKKRKPYLKAQPIRSGDLGGIDQGTYSYNYGRGTPSGAADQRLSLGRVTARRDSSPVQQESGLESGGYYEPPAEESRAPVDPAAGPAPEPSAPADVTQPSPEPAPEPTTSPVPPAEPQAPAAPPVAPTPPPATPAPVEPTAPRPQ